jgi:hypothetical protein
LHRTIARGHTPSIEFWPYDQSQNKRLGSGLLSGWARHGRWCISCQAKHMLRWGPLKSKAHALMSHFVKPPIA